MANKKSANVPSPVPEPTPVPEDYQEALLVDVLKVSSDIAGWVNDIVRYANKKIKRENLRHLFPGKKRVSSAMIVDDMLREAVWDLRQRCINPKAPVGDPEPSPLAKLPFALP